MTSDGRAARYVAIITDGNGRWAQQRGLPVIDGHQAGADVVKARLRDAVEFGVRELTVYSFSTENWSRPAEEVTALMRMFSQRIATETPELNDEGVRMRFIGRRERVTPACGRRDTGGPGAIAADDEPHAEDQAARDLGDDECRRNLDQRQVDEPRPAQPEESCGRGRDGRHHHLEHGEIGERELRGELPRVGEPRALEHRAEGDADRQREPQRLRHADRAGGEQWSLHRGAHRHCRLESATAA